MINSRVPNLFIIGAPKCGTTAMSHYLAGHPDIFMSEEAGVKEPLFYCSDLELSHINRKIREQDEYLRLFETCPATAAWIGEASPLYLLSTRAVPTIVEACNDARFVVMLRNPIELSAALHNQHAKRGVDLPDFERAWRLQGERKQGRCLPRLFTDGKLLQYGEVAKIGAQLQRLYASVEKSRVHCIFYDDFKENPDRSYRSLLSFLKLRDDGAGDFPRLNSSVTYRWYSLQKALIRISRFRSRLGLPGGLGMHALINRFNATEGRRPLRPEFLRELQDYFREDTALLADLTDRDLSSWLAGSST